MWESLDSRQTFEMDTALTGKNNGMATGFYRFPASGASKENGLADAHIP
jgi:hypothetical protein